MLGTSVTKLAGEMISNAKVFQPQTQPQSSSSGSDTNGTPSLVASSSTLIVAVVALTSLLCCISGCYMAKECLFGGAEDALDVDRKVGLTGQAEDMELAGMGGHYLA